MGACEAVGGNILTDAFGVVAMVAMSPLVTIQIIGLIYNIKIKYTTKEEAEVMEDIAEEIEVEEEKLEWIGQSCDVSDYYNWPENLEFIENMEWVNELREEKLYNQITEDNDYIDFEELEKLVLPEDFDIPKKNK
jgi:predicted membrane protein